MSVPALDLRPRKAIDLFDAALRLAARQSGLWAITLPSSALVVGALLAVVDAVQHRRADSLPLPVALLTAAWFFRGLSQGAACAFVDTMLLGQKPATVRGAWTRAFARLPSLLITVAYLFLFTWVSLPLTLGLAFFLFGSQTVGYAVTLQGKAHPLRLFGTSSRLLGPSRAAAVGVRLLYASQALVMLNLHVAANVIFYLVRKLAGIDLSFAQRFASLDNPIWVTAVVAVGFALFEPVRSATASLLLVDGRVRQEGLDLIAAMDQLPRHRAPPPKRSLGAAALWVLCGMAALVPSRAWAEGDDDADEPSTVRHLHVTHDVANAAELEKRFRRLTRRCAMGGTTVERQLEAVSELAHDDDGGLSRLLQDVEGTVQESGCKVAVEKLRHALPLVVQARDSLRRTPPVDPSARAKTIMARAEFKVDPERIQKPKEAEPPEDGEGWLERFLRWLEKFFDKDRHVPIELPKGAGAGPAKGLAIALVIAAAVVLGAILLAAWGGPKKARPELDLATSPEAPDGAKHGGALARPPEGWAALADRLARDGQYREAIRALYLALLARLHGVGAIDYDPNRSNWDYFRGFKGRAEWVPSFRELTLTFDLAYYGRTPMRDENYQTFRRVTEPLLNARAEPPHA